MDRLEKPEGYEKGPHFSFVGEKESGNIVLTVADAAIRYDHQVIAEQININIH